MKLAQASSALVRDGEELHLLVPGDIFVKVFYRYFVHEQRHVGEDAEEVVQSVETPIRRDGDTIEHILTG
jgi:hypothetical protein